MKTTIDTDSDTLKMLKYLYKHRKNGCMAKDFMVKFGKESSAFILEFCKLGYISFTVGEHPVCEHDFNSYINNRLAKELPFINGEELIFCISKGNRIVESSRRDLLTFFIPLIISIISLAISGATLAYTAFDKNPIKIEVISIPESK